MYFMYNPLLYFHYQYLIWLLDPNVEFMGYFLSRNGQLYGICIHHLDLYVPNVYDIEDSLYHCSLHKHISNAAHYSVSFNLVNFWSLCNITYFMAFLLLLSPYQRQSNRLRIPFRFTHHDNVSTFCDTTLGRKYLIKTYWSSVSFEWGEQLFVKQYPASDFYQTGHHKLRFS